MEGRSWIIVTAALLGSMVVAPGPLEGQDSYDIETRVWTDRGDEPVVRRGERVRIYYRVSRDAYVAVFHVDTDGTAQLVFPRSPEENHYVRGGHDYRLLFPRSPYWSVTDYPGVGYYFVVASPQPFDFSAFRYSHYGSGWDLTQVGRTVYRDPYRAMDDFVAHLIPDWEYTPYALDFLEYRVGDSSYRYPRFLCYDCHGFRPYTAWNPYRYTCLSFRVVIRDHPYYYSRTRYRGSSVVYTRPPVSGGPRFAFKERAEGESGAPMVVSGVADRPGVRGDPAPRRPSSSTGSQPSTTRGGDAPGTRGRTPGRDAVGSGGRSSGGEATPPRRPSSVLPGRGGTRATPPTVRVEPRPTDPARVRRPSGGGAGANRPSGSSGRERPILQRRPRSGSGSASPPSRTPVRPDQPTRRTRPPAARSGGGRGGEASGGSARPSRPPPRSSGSAGRSGGSSEGSSARPSRGGSSGGSGGEASRRPPPRRPSGGGGDDGPVSIEEMASRDRDGSTSVSSLAGSSSRRSVPVASYRPPAEDDDGVEEGRSPAAMPRSSVPTSERRPAAASRPDEGRGATPRGSDAVARRSAPSAVVAGASRPSRAEGAASSGEDRPTWVVRGARPAPSPARGQAAPRTRGSSTPSSAAGGSVVRRGSGGSSGSVGSRAVTSRSGSSRSSSPATTRSSGEARSSGTARRPSPPPRRDPPGGGGG